jgi:ABC-type branched-subunit amino acid transport system permease subunit
MILLGGLGALHGPILGAAAFVGLGEAATLLTERRRLVEGLVILAVVLVLPAVSPGFGWGFSAAGTSAVAAAAAEP